MRGWYPMFPLAYLKIKFLSGIKYFALQKYITNDMSLALNMLSVPVEIGSFILSSLYKKKARLWVFGTTVKKIL